jgi:hypothetical protein
VVMTVQSVVLKAVTLHIFEDGCQHAKKCAVCLQGQNGQLDTEGRDSMLLHDVGIPSTMTQCHNPEDHNLNISECTLHSPLLTSLF